MLLDIVTELHTTEAECFREHFRCYILASTVVLAYPRTSLLRTLVWDDLLLLKHPLEFLLVIVNVFLCLGYLVKSLGKGDELTRCQLLTNEYAGFIALSPHIELDLLRSLALCGEDIFQSGNGLFAGTELMNDHIPFGDSKDSWHIHHLPVLVQGFASLKMSDLISLQRCDLRESDIK